MDAVCMGKWVPPGSSRVEAYWVSEQVLVGSARPFALT